MTKKVEYLAHSTEVFARKSSTVCDICNGFVHCFVLCMRARTCSIMSLSFSLRLFRWRYALYDDIMAVHIASGMVQQKSKVNDN